MTGDILTSLLNNAICHLAVVTVYTKTLASWAPRTRHINKQDW